MNYSSGDIVFISGNKDGKIGKISKVCGSSAANDYIVDLLINNELNVKNIYIPRNGVITQVLNTADSQNYINIFKRIETDKIEAKDRPVKRKRSTPKKSSEKSSEKIEIEKIKRQEPKRAKRAKSPSPNTKRLIQNWEKFYKEKEPEREKVRLMKTSAKKLGPDKLADIMENMLIAGRRISDIKRSHERKHKKVL